jgi:hypothetical protein
VLLLALLDTPSPLAFIHQQAKVVTTPLAVYKSAGEVCDFLIISIPVSKASQGEVHGNPFETHVEDDWSHEKVMSTFPGIAFAQVSRNEKQDVLIGVYFASLYRKHHDILKAIYRQMAK